MRANPALRRTPEPSPDPQEPWSQRPTPLRCAPTPITCQARTRIASRTLAPARTHHVYTRAYLRHARMRITYTRVACAPACAPAYPRALALPPIHTTPAYLHIAWLRSMGALQRISRAFTQVKGMISWHSDIRDSALTCEFAHMGASFGSEKARPNRSHNYLWGIGPHLISYSHTYIHTHTKRT
jgi:hypothetical protein